MHQRCLEQLRVNWTVPVTGVQEQRVQHYWHTDAANGDRFLSTVLGCAEFVGNADL